MISFLYLIFFKTCIPSSQDINLHSEFPPDNNFMCIVFFYALCYPIKSIATTTLILLVHVELDMFDYIFSKFSMWYNTSYTLNIVNFTLTGLI